MKPTLLLIIGTAFALASCKSVDPEYDAYKAEQGEPGGQTAPFGNTDPYGSAVANPYGVPGGGDSSFFIMFFKYLIFGLHEMRAIK